MNSYQKARLASFKMIVAETKKSPASMALIPKFESAITKLGAYITEIDALQVKQEKDNTGITADTNLLIDQLIDYMVDISGALQSYAHDKNNNALLERVSFTESMLEHMGKQDILATGSLLLEEAAKLTAEELTAEGIGSSELAELKKLYESVKQDNQAPKHAIIERTGYTAKIAQLLNEASLLKKNVIDKLATQFKRKDPEFYQKYTQAAYIIYKKSGKKNGNGQENSAVTTEEQKNVKN